MQSQAEKVFAAFGGVAALRAALAEVGKPRTASVIYRWSYPAEAGGTGGLIPTRALPDVLAAAGHRHIDLSDALAIRIVANLDDIELRDMPLMGVQPDRLVLADALKAHAWPPTDWAIFSREIGTQQQLMSLFRRYADDFGGAPVFDTLAKPLTWLRLHIALSKAPAVIESVRRRADEGLVLIYVAQPGVAAHIARGLGAIRLPASSPFTQETKALSKFRASGRRVLIAPTRAGPPLDFFTHVIVADASWRTTENLAAIGRIGKGKRVLFASLKNSHDTEIQRALREAIRNACASVP